MLFIAMTDPNGAARNMVLHGSHQYTPFMLVYIYIPAPWIRHGIVAKKVSFMMVITCYNL